MKEHPQAHILRAIAEGKTIEMRRKTSDTDNEWWVSNIVLQYLDDADREFRIKPETLLINGHEVPAPVREPLEYEIGYYVPCVSNKQRFAIFSWSGSGDDLRLLALGLIHLTPEAAIAHTEAQLSFTRSDKCAT